MRHLLTVLVLSGMAWAAPPVVTVPKEIAGDVGDFVAVKAEVQDGKSVKFVPLDAGLKLFPAGLLSDPTATVVTSAKAGRYRILCYSGNVDGPSDPVTVTVVIGGSTPIVDPVKPDPVKPEPTAVFYFAVVGPSGPVAPATADAMKLPAWDELRKAGHQVNYIPVHELNPDLPRPKSLPEVMVLKKSGDKWTDTGSNKPLPTTDEQVRGLLK